MGDEHEQSGEGLDGARDPFEIVATKLSRAMPSINSRRALEIIERRKGSLSNESSPNNSHSYSLAAARIIVTEHDLIEASQAEVCFSHLSCLVVHLQTIIKGSDDAFG